jgi:hypothetical protein
MSNIISEVVKIKFNSFNLAPAMLSYFENCQVKQDNVLLLYLLFPVVLNRDWIGGSPRAQKRSRLETWVKENRIHVEGLPERITTFQRLSETTLQYCIDMEYAKVDGKNNVVVTNNPFKNKGRYTDSAIRLTRLIGSSTPAKVYATFGIRELELV